MSIYDRMFGDKKSNESKDYIVSPGILEKEFGKINVRDDGVEKQVQVTILMEPQGREAEGWQTGVALDASSSMKGWFGRMAEGSIPPNIFSKYEKQGWVTTSVKDGRKVKSYKSEAIDDAKAKGYIKLTDNIVEPVARDFIEYLAGNLDADGGTTVIYWACDDGTSFEVLGDVTEDQCKSLEIKGPLSHSFGSGTSMHPALKYFSERFTDAKRGMFIFITDGKIDDLQKIKDYTTEIAKEIDAAKRNLIKCVLIGVGNEIDESQMEELDDLDTGTDIDIWDHKISKEMRSLMEIFAEVVDENQLVAPTATITDANGKVVKRYSDGLPAKISFTLPSQSDWFELNVAGRIIHQKLT